MRRQNGSRGSHAYLEEDAVVLANLEDLGLAHERVQVNLVDGREGDLLVDEFLYVHERVQVNLVDGREGDLLVDDFLYVLGAKVGHLITA
jgi:hypothetical protein